MLNYKCRSKCIVTRYIAMLFLSLLLVPMIGTASVLLVDRKFTSFNRQMGFAGVIVNFSVTCLLYALTHCGILAIVHDEVSKCHLTTSFESSVLCLFLSVAIPLILGFLIGKNSKV